MKNNVSQCIEIRKAYAIKKIADDRFMYKQCDQYQENKHQELL